MSDQETDVKRIPPIVEKYVIFGKTVCLRNSKHRHADGRHRSAVADRLKRQWDYCIQHSKNTYERAQREGEKTFDILPDQSKEMLERHFMEHIDDPDIQNARNRFFVAEACSRKRAAVEKLWEAPQQDDESEDRQKEHMTEYMKYQKMYASITHESTGCSKRNND